MRWCAAGMVEAGKQFRRSRRPLIASVGRCWCGAVEVGQDVGGAGVQGSPDGVQLAQRGGDTVAQRLDERRHQRSASGAR